MIHKDFQCEFYFIRHGESTSNARPGYAADADFNAPLYLTEVSRSAGYWGSALLVRMCTSTESTAQP